MFENPNWEELDDTERKRLYRELNYKYAIWRTAANIATVTLSLIGLIVSIAVLVKVW